ncbi:MAG: type II toxin-antitoxin system RelE/ParE family toxin [Jannaschia sp.]
MPRLIWTPAALHDIDRLYRFLKSKNPRAAAAAVRAIRGGMRIVGDEPGVGCPIEGMDPAFRDRLIPYGDSGYVARYRIDEDTAVILAVRHQKEAGFG